MNSERERWIDGIKTLEIKAEDLYENNNPERFNRILEILEEDDIYNLTIRDMIDFMKRQLGLKSDPSIEEIFAYIMDGNNKEKLVRLGQAKNPIDTRANDRNQKKDELSNNGIREELYD